MVGMLQDHYLIVTNPQPFADLDEKLSLEQRVIIKYVHKGRVWMFKAQLLKTVESPYQLLFFEYPVVIHYHELRESKRSAIFIPCTFHMSEEPELYGTLIDLSMTGALCQIRHKATAPAADRYRRRHHSPLPAARHQRGTEIQRHRQEI